MIIRPLKFGTIKRRANEAEVQSGLSLTPSQMMQMAAEGAPITPNQLQGVYIDSGDEAPLMHKRGVDMADLWNAEKDFKKNAKSALKRKKFTEELEKVDPEPPVEPKE